MNQAKPVVAILGGTGKEGPGLALRWAKAGYPILIGSRQAEKAQATAQEINQTLGLQTVQGYENTQAARQAEICVLTVVQTAHQEALIGLKEALQGKILVDATARVDFRDPKPPAPPTAARIAQDLLGEGVRVVAAFQNVPAAALRKLDQPLHSHVLVCADDLAAAQAVIQLAHDGGMNAYYAGGLDNAIVVEGLTALLISLNKHYKTKTASICVAGLPEA
ncbi:MAG: NADPH-dependent F420 reductase [Anaerolineae bacterium]|jgi:NADPH-dependent F420 reductase|nr:MAG: NADPH-dependent F420 reductase [Anaerolineae bacterium]